MIAVIKQFHLSVIDFSIINISKYQQRILFVLFLLVFGSSLFITYQKHVTRQLQNKYQALLSVNSKLEVDWRKLLLEKTTLQSLTRIANLAEDKYYMYIPHNKQIHLVQLEN